MTFHISGSFYCTFNNLLFLSDIQFFIIFVNHLLDKKNLVRSNISTNILLFKARVGQIFYFIDFRKIPIKIFSFL